MIDYMFLLMIDHVCIEILVNLFLQTTLYLTQTLSNSTYDPQRNL